MEIKCKWCLSANIIKDGKLRGKQLYHCKDCGRKFSDMDRTSIYDWFIAWNLRHKCNNKFKKNRYTQTKLTDNQIAKVLSRNYLTVTKWAGSKEPPKVLKPEFLQYLKNREHGGDLLLLLGLKLSSEPMSDFLRGIITRKPKQKKEITKKELERQARIERQEELWKEKQNKKERAINTPISDRKNAIGKLLILFDCSKRLLYGLRYADIEDKNVGDIFEIKYSIHFEKGKTKVVKGISSFDYGHQFLQISSEKILEVIKWLKSDTAYNRQRLGANYDNSYLDFICVNENGKFYYPHELNKD